MAQIFLSYSKPDVEAALQLASVLKESGHTITVDVESLSVGQDWRRRLAEGLRQAEIFVVLISNSSIRSQSVLQELGAARAYAAESDRMIVIPVLIDRISIPLAVQDILVIDAVDHDWQHVALEISRSIAEFFGRRAAKEEKAAEVAKKIEINAANYIEEAIQTQRSAAAWNSNIGFFWYIVGFLSLVAGIAFSVFALGSAYPTKTTIWTDVGIVALKSIVVIGLLAACSKYSFSLGKSYISESLKCSDRIHAISFGKFYLRVYGDKATWVELKEVFQHWNIDRTSTFSSLDAAQIDPQILTLLSDLVKSVVGQAKK